MDKGMSLDPLADLKIENEEMESNASQNNLSELDKLKMELEKELMMALQPQEKEVGAECNSKAIAKYTMETHKSGNYKMFDTKKSIKASANNIEKILLSTPTEETIHLHNEKPNNLIVKIKMFDRTLVVNGFSEDVSLYTLSRAWMKNQTTSLASSQYNIFAILAAASKRQNNGIEVLQQLQNGETMFICSMPATPKNAEVENSRVPSAEQLGIKHKPNIAVLDNILNTQNVDTEEELPNKKENLLHQHKLRWKRTKSNWIKHVRNSDKHYEVNFTILETLYKSQMKTGSNLVESNMG